MKNIDTYYPLHIWLQRLDSFGIEAGEPVQTTNDAMLHAQVGDTLEGPRYKSEKIDSHFDGLWRVQERKFSEHRTDPYNIPRNLTLYIEQP